MVYQFDNMSLVFREIDYTFVNMNLYILTPILDVRLNGKKMKRKMISFEHISISMSFITDSKFLCSFKKKLLTENHWMENSLLTVL